MVKELFQGNRARPYAQRKENSLLTLFSGTEARKTSNEFYPFCTSRDFLYLTGPDGKVSEKIFLLPAHRATPRAIDGIGNTMRQSVVAFS